MEPDVSKEQVPVPASTAPADAAGSPREVLAQQIASGKIDRSSIYAQLTNNPFFTAVRLIDILYRPSLFADTDAIRVSASQH